jgi:hypothetical protein
MKCWTYLAVAILLEHPKVRRFWPHGFGTTTMTIEEMHQHLARCVECGGSYTVALAPATELRIDDGSDSG